MKLLRSMLNKQAHDAEVEVCRRMILTDEWRNMMTSPVVAEGEIDPEADRIAYELAERLTGAA